MVVTTDETVISQLIRREVQAAVGALVSEPPREVLSTEEAASFLGVSKAFLERARVEGGGPVYAKFGVLVRYRREDLLAWLGDRVISNTSERSAS